MMQHRVGKTIALFGSAILMSVPAFADGVTTELSGFNEVPAISSEATGEFQARLNETGDQLTYTLTYSGIATPVQFAHLHLGQAGANGGIAVWLCDNSGGAPVSVQACPQSAGTIEGTITSADVVGPTEQGLAASEFAELLDAIGAGALYVNVHSETFPAGEIRGQLKPAFNQPWPSAETS